jgi:drug/metabolite transporter (DMT)-like permease
MKSSWMLVAGFFFAVMGICVKLGSSEFSALELVFYRSLFGLVFIAGIIKVRGGTLATTHGRMHISRGLSGLASLSFYFYSLTQLPVATAVTLNYTSPMFLALVTVLWYRERVRPQIFIAILLGFAGVILVLRPALSESQLPAGLLGLTSGFLASIAYLNVKQLSATGEPDWRVVFYFCLICTIISGVLLFFYEVHAVSLRGAAILLAIGACATIAQLALTRAYRIGKTLLVGSLAYSTVVFASVLGLVLLEEILPWLSWLGIAIIIAAGLFAARESAGTSD